MKHGLSATIGCLLAVGSGRLLAIDVHFVDVSAARGIGPHVVDDGHGSGASAEDYDFDGDIDLFVPQGEGVPNRLYRNLGNGAFEEIAAQVGLDSTDSARVALWLDYDADGRMDLFVANDDLRAASSFAMYRQNPGGSFSDVTVAAGVFKTPVILFTTHHWGGICAGDINRDGYLDIYTGQWPGPGHLFLNTASGGFSDISLPSGVSITRHVHQPVMADFNADGWTDIYVAVDFAANLLWINQHNNQFINQAAAAGLANAMNDMGLSLGDYDNDGDFDPYITNIWMTAEQPGGPRYNVLYQNNSSGAAMSYSNVSQFLGVDNGYFGWGATYLDADNDGDLDIAATNGWRDGVFVADPSRFFENPGGPGPFGDVSAATGFDDTEWGSALIAADLDRDGDLDLVQACVDGPLRILDNQPAGEPLPHHYLVVQPRMSGPNHRAIGAVVRVAAGGRTMSRIICAGNSYMAQEPAEAFFGLGSAAVADSVTVHWPDGAQTVMGNVAADRVLVVQHSGGAVPALSPRALAALLAGLMLASAWVLRRRAAGPLAAACAAAAFIAWPVPAVAAPGDSLGDPAFPAARRAAGAAVPFSEEAVSRGLVYAMQNWPQSYGYLGFGCGLVDLDGDHDLEAVIIGAADGHVGLFENDGTGHFIDRSATSGIPPLPGNALPSSGGSALAAADYDGDGDLDLYFTRMGQPNVLMRNDGGLQFTSVAGPAGVADAGSGKGVAFGDYNGDGWLDLYVCNYNGLVAGTGNLNNKLYRNRGNGTFEDVSAALGVDDPGKGFQAVWFDHDRDGDVDLYLSNDRGGNTAVCPEYPAGCPHNRLWRNDGGALVDVSAASGTDIAIDSMGVACGDFDGNGWPDLYCTNITGVPMPGISNQLLLNQGNGAFIEASQASGVVGTFGVTGWGAIFFDFDNDTHLDLYVNNQFHPNQLFTHGGSFPCVNMAGALGVTGGSTPSFGSAAGDVDRDGDVDLLVNNLQGNVLLFINNEGQARHWIRYRVAGLAPNRHAVGASIDTFSAGKWQLREVLAGGNSYLGMNELVQHVGLAESTAAQQVEVRWPGGSPQRTLHNLPADRAWTLYPPQALGDADEDGLVLNDDFVVFAGCHQAPFEPGCEMMDFDGDSDVDTADYLGFLGAFDGPLTDCDEDGQLDMAEILTGAQADTNTDGVPDECATAVPAASGAGLGALCAALAAAGAAVLKRRSHPPPGAG